MSLRYTPAWAPVLICNMMLAALSCTAAAHVLGAVVQNQSLHLGWNFDAWASIPWTLSVVLYGLGYTKIQSQRRRTARSSFANSRRKQHLVSFAGGSAVLGMVLFSPLDDLSHALFSAHMVVHECMMLVAAPLLVAGRPLGIWLWAFDAQTRQWISRVLRFRGLRFAWQGITLPISAWLFHAVALWVWHVPALFDAALRSPALHALQHASFLLSALDLWWTVLGTAAGPRVAGRALLSLFTTMVHTGVLGALITLAPGIWYIAYIEPTSALGIDALRDQQLGGLVMWVPGGLAYLLGGLLLVGRHMLSGDAVRVHVARDVQSVDRSP